MALMERKILISNNNFAVEIYRISCDGRSKRGNDDDNWNNKLEVRQSFEDEVRRKWMFCHWVLRWEDVSEDCWELMKTVGSF
jgi:hypothetical protein